MLTINLNPVLNARNIERPFSFLIKAGFSSHTASSFLDSSIQRPALNQIEKVCELLNCTPNDILTWQPNDKSSLPISHPLNKLKKKDVDYKWQESLKTMPLEQLNEIAAIISKMNSQPT